jgi:cytochrome P450
MPLAPDTGSYLAAPHLVWHDLLARARPLHYGDDLGLWLISGHRQVRAALADQDAFRNVHTLMPIYQPCAAASAILAKIDAPPTTAAADPPIHPRTRRALKAAFASGRSTGQAYGGIVTGRINQLVQQVAARRPDRVDLVAEFAGVLPLLVVADIIGVPEPDLPRVKTWADGQIALVWGFPNAAEQVRLAQDLLDFWTYSGQLANNAIRAHAAGHRTNTFLNQLLHWRTSHGEDQVSDAEIASLAFNLLVAGHETTAGLIAHVLDHALAAAPQRWQQFATDPQAAAEHVEGDAAVHPTDRRLAAHNQPTRRHRRHHHPGQRTLPAADRGRQPRPGPLRPPRHLPTRPSARSRPPVLRARPALLRRRSTCPTGSRYRAACTGDCVPSYAAGTGLPEGVSSQRRLPGATHAAGTS